MWPSARGRTELTDLRIYIVFVFVVGFLSGVLAVHAWQLLSQDYIPPVVREYFDRE